LTRFSFSYPKSKSKDVLKTYYDISLGATNDLFARSTVSMSQSGNMISKISGSFFGRPSDLDQILSPLKVLGTAKSESISAIDYLKLQSAVDGGFNAAGYKHYAKGGFIRNINQNLADAIVDSMEHISGRGGFSVSLVPMGGAIGEVRHDETAWSNRDAIYNVETNTPWQTDKEEIDTKLISWHRGYWKMIEPFTRGYYVNVRVENNRDKIRSNYGVNYARLVKIKSKYDRDNFFRFNSNILPDL